MEEAWMKKEVDILGAEFVLDEFHIRKYIRKMARLGDRVTEEGKEKTAGMNRKRKQEKTGRQGCPKRWGANEKRRKESCRKLGIPKEKLKRSTKSGEKRGRSDRKQYREPYQPCVVNKEKLTADGVEQGRSRQGVTSKDILEKWKEHAETGKVTERRRKRSKP